LANLQEHYGTNADVNQNGTVSQNVYIVNDGINPSSEGFSNSGINVNGKTVWVKSSIADGITYYAAGVAYEEISAAIQNKKLENKVKQSLRQERIFLENTMTADYLEIDTVTENKTGTEYGQTGTARIYLGTGTEYMQTDMIYFDRVRDIRNAEGWQRARSIMIFLNKTKTIADFEKYLKILKNASNGNIIITEEFAQILAQSNKLAPVLEQLRKDGISIMVEKTADSKLPANVLNLFDGTFDPETGNIERAQAGKKGTVELNVEIISDAKTMEDSYKRTNKNVVFFETAIEEYVQSDRAGLGKFLQDITSPKILKYFAEITAEPAITDKSAAETARNFNIEKVLDDFPDLTAGDIKAMFEALQNGVPAEEIFLLDHLNVNSAVRMYLAEIDRRVEDKTAISDIKKAYMEGLAEKLAASVAFRNAKRVYGFKNKNNEKLVGELALLKYTGSETTVADAAISDRLRNMTFLNYNNEITSIINENPEAIPAVADLMLDMIFAYAMEVKTNKKDYKQEPNLQALNAILSAA
ncbi:MAG: hypothetical protein LBL00_03705, partial [Endomicrobium sp.]|nr:hypothetical protein [Endomicrobium sp.]